ncbi:hypothetical protein P154DRAFT_612849 [Amniculicola lignicola CBS 123094]|uniref:SAP domain-containing protein n=1 Tax=Amniculicola lignicola CBS 123094 TaxID=1392246 RepID=A0A6A5VYX1_9PLEO|nr:hypothetical protein P154DRAFT_612849 [Amniculicola lignicola CBS 123094]
MLKYNIRRETTYRQGIRWHPGVRFSNSPFHPHHPESTTMVPLLLLLSTRDILGPTLNSVKFQLRQALTEGTPSIEPLHRSVRQLGLLRDDDDENTPVRFANALEVFMDLLLQSPRKDRGKSLVLAPLDVRDAAMKARTWVAPPTFQLRTINRDGSITGVTVDGNKVTFTDQRKLKFEVRTTQTHSTLSQLALLMGEIDLGPSAMAGDAITIAISWNMPNGGSGGFSGPTDVAAMTLSMPSNEHVEQIHFHKEVAQKKNCGVLRITVKLVDYVGDLGVEDLADNFKDRDVETGSVETSDDANDIDDGEIESYVLQNPPQEALSSLPAPADAARFENGDPIRGGVDDWLTTNRKDELRQTNRTELADTCRERGLLCRGNRDVLATRVAKDDVLARRKGLGEVLRK